MRCRNVGNLGSSVEMRMVKTQAGKSSHAIVLFDGVCNLCDASVNFIIDRDPDAYFQFASQQSPAGQALLRKHGLAGDEPQTIVLISNGRPYVRSEAALR